MILIKADSQLEPIFQRLIRTLGVKVEWNSIFMIKGSQLILPGRVRSLYFDYDNKRVYTNIEEFTENTWNVEESQGNDVLMNVFNMTLYAFGKWGSIPLKVDKDYSVLNRLFVKILKEVRIEPDYQLQGYKFFQSNIQVTYEDVVQKALDWGKPEEEKEEADGEESEQEAVDTPDGEPDEDSEGMGLWHRLVWKREQVKIIKSPRTEADGKRARLGRNFYMVDYNCPLCSNKLYMVVYPVNREYVIETDEGRLFMARAYTCSEGCSFYTPAPDKLLAEGDVYSYHFEDDRKAYEDYLELIGRTGGRYSNYKFNELESQRLQKEEEENNGESLEAVSEASDELTQGKLAEVMEKIDGGFYSEEDVKKYGGRIAEAMEQIKAVGRRRDLEPGSRDLDGSGSNKKTADSSTIEAGSQKKRQAGGKQGYVPYKGDKSFYNISNNENSMDNQNGNPPQIGNGPGDTNIGAVNIPAGRNGSLFRNKSNILGEGAAQDLNEGLQARNVLKKAGKTKIEGPGGSCTGGGSSRSDSGSEKNKNANITGTAAKAAQDGSESTVRNEKNPGNPGITGKTAAPDSFSRRPGENLTDWMRRGAESCRKKSYGEIGDVIREFKREGEMDEEQTSILFRLEEMKRRKGISELTSLFERMPEMMDVKHYDIYKDTLNQYKDMDISSWEKELEDRRDRTETHEIADFVNRAPKNNRDELSRLYDELKKLDYRNKNKEPFLKKIYDRLYATDQNAIQAICPDIMDLSFGEALEVYDEIEKGTFLPELKTNTLEMLKKRLTRMKTEENSQLIRKFMRDLDDKIKNSERLHFYDAGNMLRKRVEPKEAAILNRAVETYGSELNPYEYPLIIGDSSRRGTGKEGFILTPDHIFYSTKLMEGKLDIMDVDEVSAAKGKLGNALTVLCDGGKSKKIPAAVPKEEREAMAEVLQEFILYLQEKPESRQITYLAKERHEVKCCLRCGYQYRDGNICPKCGSKANR